MTIEVETGAFTLVRVAQMPLCLSLIVPAAVST